MIHHTIRSGGRLLCLPVLLGVSIPGGLCAAEAAPEVGEARLVLRLGKDLGPIQAPLLGNNVIAYHDDAAGLWNPDRQDFVGPMLEVLKPIAPKTLRFPGGCFAHVHHWKLGIGPAADRGSGDFGPGPFRYAFGTDEFLRLCHLLDSTPVMTVNYATGTPEEAAEWVEYCNGSTNTTWGARRAENGFPAPWDVPYWEIGNEEDHGVHTRFGPDAEHEPPPSALEYGTAVVRFAAAMKAVDPRVKVGAVLHPPRNWGWHDNVLAACGHVIDFVILHYYYPGASSLSARSEAEMVGATLAGADDMAAHLGMVRRMLGEHPATRDRQRQIQILITEWNTMFLGELGAWQYGVVPAAHAAAVIARLQNAGPPTGTTAAHFWHLANGWTGLVKGYESPYTRRPAWFVFDWARNRLQTRRCDFGLATPTFDHAGIANRLEPAFGFEALPGEAFVAIRVGREGSAPLDGEWALKSLLLEREPLAGEAEVLAIDAPTSLPAGVEALPLTGLQKNGCRLRFTDCRAPFLAHETLVPIDPGERLGLQVTMDASQTRCAPPNLLPNPGFEEGATGWRRGEDPPTVESSIGPAPEDTRAGGSALHLRFREGAGDGRYCHTSQRLPVEPAGLYSASAWIRTQDLDGEAVLEIADAERGWQRFHVETSRISGTTGAFIQRQVWFRVPPGTTAVHVSCGAYRATRGEAWFDDLSVEDVSVHMPGVMVQFRDANGRGTRTVRIATPAGNGPERLAYMGCPALVPLATVDAEAGRCAVLIANRHPLAAVRLETTVADAAITGPVRFSLLESDGPGRTNEDGETIVPRSREIPYDTVGLRARIEPLELPPCSVSLIEFDCALND